MSETIPLNHPREPKKSCMDFDRADESLKKARAVNKELRDWGRKEAEALDEIIKAAHSSKDARDFIMWVIEKYPKP